MVRRAPANAPSLSVIITNFNYAPYLEAAIVSVLAQSHPVEELIVVDDGSSDGSEAILLRYKGRLTSIRKPNEGQASAFNAGISECSGDIVLFLDADDELERDASALIRAAWAPSLAALGYRMNVINEMGSLTGAYPVRPKSGDMRPELLARGQFPFVPTSGNAFNATLLRPLFPLPEARWRISADAVLVRLAAMLGPIRQLDMPLARYRAHGSNSYYRAAEPQQAVQDRAVQDAVDACLATASLLERDATLAVAVFELRRVALNLALAARASGDPTMPLGKIVRIAGYLRGAAIPSRVAIASVLLQVALLASGGRIGRSFDRHRRSRFMRSLGELCLGRAFMAARRDLHRSRWLIPNRARQSEDGKGEDSEFNLFDWGRTEEGMALQRTVGDIEILPLDVAADGFRLDMEILGSCDSPKDVQLSANGKRLVAAQIEGRSTLSAIIGPGQLTPGGAVTISVRAKDPANRWPWSLTSIFRSSASTQIIVQSITYAKLGSNLAVPLPIGDDAIDLTVPYQGVTRAADGTVTLLLNCPGSKQTATLEVCFTPDQPPGLLTATTSGNIVLRAKVEPSARLLLPMPSLTTNQSTPIRLKLNFYPLDNSDDAELHLKSIRQSNVMPPRSAALSSGIVYDALELAQTTRVFADGWDVTEAVELAGLSGVLKFSLPHDVGPSSFLDIAMLLPGTTSGTGARLVVTLAEEVLPIDPQAENGVVRVPLAHAVSRGLRQLDIAIHAATGTLDVPQPTRLRILSLSLQACPMRVPDRRTALRIPTLFSFISDTASALRRASDPVCDARTVARIDKSLKACKKCDEVLSTAQMLDDLLLIGAAYAASGASPPASVCVALSQDELPRTLARAMMLAPPWRALDAPAFLETLEKPLLFRSEQIARYLASDWHQAVTPDDLRAYERHVLSCVSVARVWLASHPPDSPRYSLASALLERLHPLPLLFSGHDMRPIAEAIGRAIETYHLSRDRRITLPASPEPGPRIRIAALLRRQADVPEARIVAGMLGALPVETFDVTVYTLERDEHPYPLPDQFRVVPLDWPETESAVTAMRSAQPHIFWLASHFSGFDNVAAIVAHRIAPVQIATTAVSPSTTGLSSFDFMLSDQENTSPYIASQYKEKLIIADHMLQRFERSGILPDRVQASAILRARLGLPDEAVVLVSTAHTDKISQDLLALWLKIVAAVPQAVLVLYPFAQNWHLGRSRAGFVARIRAACERHGVSMDRVRIEPPVAAYAIPEILAGADLFLDSFPYSGATTVFEALQTGTPVIALDLAKAQVGKQGASWAKAWGLAYLVAETPEAYADLAIALGKSPQARTEARRAMRLRCNADRDSYGAKLAATIQGLPGVPPCEEPARYVFHHMAKAGGTTCRRVLSEWFEVIMDEREPWGNEPSGPPVDIARLHPHQMLWSHFNPASQRLSTRYPSLLADPGFRLVTFIRDPLEVALSAYFFECRHRSKYDPEFTPLPLDQHLCEAPLRPLLYHLSSIDTDWERALDRYWFIGTLEQLQPCLAWLAKAFGRPLPPELPHLNQTPRSVTPSSRAVTEFRRRAAMDYDIYRAARSKMERLLAEDPQSFARRPTQRL